MDNSEEITVLENLGLNNQANISNSRYAAYTSDTTLPHPAGAHFPAANGYDEILEVF